MTTAPFPNRPRVDAREKVTGRLKYAADVAVEGLLYGMMVPSTIARGRVIAVSTEAALAVPGVVRVLTAADCSAAPPPGPGGPPPPPMIVDRISYRGEPVALVVADALLEKFGGDSVGETRRNVEGYLQALRYR